MSNYPPYPGQPYMGQPYPNIPGQPSGPQPGPNPGMGQAVSQPMNPSGYLCRPVTSREEAVASQVDFLGPGSIMPDFGHGMIYFKRFNPNSGSAEFYAFSLQQQPSAPAQQPAPAAQVYDPRQDIEGLRNDVEALRGELDEIKKTGQRRTGGKAAEQ